ncbi:MAG: replication-associated recombination protein A [Candidatus Omnitrophica bacterium]|nr:replication-associated recombination protein A [Candidatus Omnitrophota bacterium]MDD5310143.1 replication-associated recombination protein A [Candidatus Omnitrophota bacterium]MDD5546280.1 replication-associated recombination protein A [Candidatus Omnitrophota bacterium]
MVNSSLNKDLFEKKKRDSSKPEPLAVRMRPRALKEFTGQGHIIGPGKLLTRAIEADTIASLVLYGPPGTGKTTLAHVVSNATKAEFVQLNATTSNVQEMRKEIEAAKQRRALYDKKTILFVDEIHRFNKAQQDVLMPDVEAGVVILIGATTYNPFFSIVAPLISRSLVFELKPLSEADITTILDNALKDRERGLGNMPVKTESDALKFLAKISEGDARRALNALELAALTTPKSKDGTINITLQAAEECIQKKAVVYDRDEDGHYDTISAFIKSMRGSDPDAALYWLAKMLYAGEDPRFIARRIVICAAEDVGLADPQAIVVANAALQISEFVGLPEAKIPLAEATVYIACAPKSNSAYLGVEKALKDVEAGRVMEVPAHLKDASMDSEALGHGKGYKYAHDYKGHFVEQEYMPKKATYYEPTEIGFEKQIKERIETLWKRRQKP